MKFNHTHRCATFPLATLGVLPALLFGCAAASRAPSSSTAPGQVSETDAPFAIQRTAWRFAGADGQIVADHAHSWVSRLSGRTSETYRLNEEGPTVRETLVDFVRLVRGEIDNPIPVLEGARAVAVAEACVRSASTGREEKVELSFCDSHEALIQSAERAMLEIRNASI